MFDPDKAPGKFQGTYRFYHIVARMGWYDVYNNDGKCVHQASYHAGAQQFIDDLHAVRSDSDKFWPQHNAANGINGYVGPFATREQAQLMLDFAKHCGCEQARITSHSSQLMTSDNSPIVINVTAECIARYNAATE